MSHKNYAKIQSGLDSGQKYFKSSQVRKSIGMKRKDFDSQFLDSDNWGEGPLSGRLQRMSEKVDSMVPGGAIARHKERVKQAKERFTDFLSGFFSGKNKKNQGGPVVGASGIDQIPAMLSEGEYVIRADAARKIGRPTLESMNAGKFNNGGIVTNNSSGMQDQSGSSANTNNISITVNVDSGGGSDEKKETESGGDKKDKMDKMSARIKDQVVTVIKEESRPGGLLDKGEGN